MRSAWVTCVLVVAAAAGCSSEEFTAGSGGQGGDAGGAAGSAGSGAAGAGGTGATSGTGGTSGTGAGGGTGATSGSGGTGGLPTGCTGDGECDDNLGCNGKETCNAGTCVAGTAVSCSNPDATHCIGECVENAGTATCIVKGKDTDGDTHLDMKCTASSLTADDCDDGNKNVHPGASEVCDGIDNDCNGKDELEEGTSISGSAADFFKASDAYTPAVAWSPVSKQYGVVWLGAGGVQFARMSATGAMVGTPVTVEPGALEAPRIAWSGTHFGVTWLNGLKVMFRRVAPGATFPEGAKVISDGAAKALSPDLAATNSGWMAIWSDKRSNTWGTLYARAIDAAGSPTGATDTQVATSGGTNGAPAIASIGTGLFVAQERGSAGTPNSVKVFGMSPAFVVTGEKAVSADPLPSGTTAVRPAVAPTGEGWAMAWSESAAAGDKVRYYEQRSNGQAACSPLALPGGSPAIVAGVAARGGSRVTVFGQDTGFSAKVQLVRFKTDCKSPLTQKVSDTDVPDWTSFGIPALAWSDKSAVVLWVDHTTGTSVLRRWISGPNLCDAPVP